MFWQRAENTTTREHLWIVVVMVTACIIILILFGGCGGGGNNLPVFNDNGVCVANCPDNGDNGEVDSKDSGWVKDW